MDVGPGVVAQLLRRNTPSELDAVVISHSTPITAWTRRSATAVVDRRRQAAVIVPPGATAQLAEMALGAGYMNFFDRASSSWSTTASDRSRCRNLRLEPDETQHFVRTWGFRISARGTGEDGQGAGLLGRCRAVPGIAAHRRWRRAVPGEAALRSPAGGRPGAAEPRPPAAVGGSAPGARSEVKRLLLTHIPLPDRGAWAMEQAAAEYEGPLEIAEPLRTYEV